MQTFPFPVFCDFVKKIICVFAFCAITFEPIKIQTCSAPQNDYRKLSGKKMARNGQKMAIGVGGWGAVTIDDDPCISCTE